MGLRWMQSKQRLKQKRVMKVGGDSCIPIQPSGDKILMEGNETATGFDREADRMGEKIS